MQITDRGIRRDFVRVSRAQLQIASSTRYSIRSLTEQWHKSFRAARLVDDSRRFVIVSIADKGAQNPAERDTMKDIVVNGLECNGKRYAWLGYTESQLKASQFVLFREDGHWTARKLLALLGDLLSVYEMHGYGKYAARLGLSFSSTSVALKIPSRQMIEILDKPAIDGSLTTDGVGMIRESLAKEVRASLELPEDITVFQTRLGGIKGVFCAYPDDVFDRLVSCTGYTIAYRSSMHKYDSGLTDFEVCGVSRRSPRGRLCVQFILLLLSLGTPIVVFEELLSEQIEDISSFMQDRKKAVELLELTDNAELDANGQGFCQDLYGMLLAGYSLNEPRLKCLMERFQGQRYKSLYEKLAIEVRNSTRLYGVADELGVLGDNEVYINLPNRSGVLVGTVAVSRNPAYALGDIRVLTAVNKPELAHLKNCVVFPTKCQRSIPDTMGGGDLDGDDYWITWDPRLIPPKVEPPPDRTTSQPDHPMTSRSEETLQIHAADTFVNLRNSGRGMLGELCKYWEDVTRSSADYAHSYKSKALVPLIEEAMDMVKRGTQLRQLREKYNRLKNRRVQQKTTEDPLNRLREMIPYRGNTKPKFIHFTPESALDLRGNPSYQEEWERYYKEGEKLCGEFNKALQEAIAKDREYPDLESIRSVDLGVQKHTDATKREWIEKYFSGTTSMQHSLEFARASAWYICGYEKGKEAFAWLGAQYLNMMMASATRQGRIPLAVGDMSTPLVPGTPTPVSHRQLPASYPSISSGDSSPLSCPPSPQSSCTLREYSPSPESLPKRAESPRRLCSESSSITNRSKRNQKLPSTLHDITNQQSPETDAQSNPKPQSPVTIRPGDVSPCTNGQQHLWRCNWANGTTRRYVCQLGCTIQVKEKKDGTRWTLLTIVN